MALSKGVTGVPKSWWEHSSFLIQIGIATKAILGAPGISPCPSFDPHLIRYLERKEHYRTWEL